MKVTLESQDKASAKFLIEITPDFATQEYNKACKRLGQRLNVPGFRRGKVPRAVIVKTVGDDRIKQEALDRILPALLADAVSEHQLDIVTAPTIDKEGYKFDLNEGVQVKVSFELRPEVTLPDYTSITVDVEEVKIPEGAAEEEYKKLIDKMITLEPVLDRPSQADDIVTIDFSGSISGELIRGGAAKNFRLDLANNNFIDGFSAQLVGHKIGEEFSIKVEFPKDYHDASLAGKPADFQIKLNDVQRKVTPELNDELAKKLGYENLAALQANVQDDLNKAKEEEQDYRKQKALVDWFVEQAQVDIPDSMINREARLLMEEVRQQFKSNNMVFEQFIDAQGQESIWENLRQEAKKRIKTSLSFGTFSKTEAIRISEEDFSHQVKEIAESRSLDEKMVMRQLANNPNALQSMSDQLLSQKIVSFLMERASFNIVPGVTIESSTSSDEPSEACELPSSSAPVADADASATSQPESAEASV